MAMSRPNHQSLIASLQLQLDKILRPLIIKGEPCALLQFPVHHNVGDAIIWLAEEIYLNKLGAKIVYESDVFNHSHRQLAARIGGGTIFFHGGGNLGDLWPMAQRSREEIVRAFPNNKIVLFPQSLHFERTENLVRAQSIFDAHHALTLLVRDKSSLAAARDIFEAPSFLCPDMALGLGVLYRSTQPKHEIVWLNRRDKESRYESVPQLNSDIDLVDWVGGAPEIAQVFIWLMEMGPFWRRLQLPLRGRIYHWLAMRQLVRGSRMLSRGKVVITDRLHGHILSMLMGIPHILLDNSYGKIRNFYETWTKDCSLTCWANSPSEALRLGLFEARRISNGVLGPQGEHDS